MCCEGYTERFGYRPDGLLSSDSVVTSLGVPIRATASTYNEARGEDTRIANGVAYRDTLGVRYSGLRSSTRRRLTAGLIAKSIH